MKSLSVSHSRGQQWIRELAKVGLAALLIMPMAPTLAEEGVAEGEMLAEPAPVVKKAVKSAKKIARVTKERVKVPTVPAECVRTGQRVIAALARDDSGAAGQFYAFYDAFDCARPHLAQAFGCLVKLQSANPGLSNPSPEQVNQCWDNPASASIAPIAQPSASPGANGEKK